MNRFHRWYCDSDRWQHTVEERLLPWASKGVDFGPVALEIGPGPGVTTALLRDRVEHLDAVEIDPVLAERLRTKLAGTNVVVHTADATRLPFADGVFSGAACFTMLHHVPSEALQDQLLNEVRRVLQPGGTFAGSDSTSSLLFRAAHLFDTMVPVEPDRFAARLEAAGFTQVKVERVERAFKWRAHKPAAA